MRCSQGHLVSGDYCKLCNEVFKEKKAPVTGIKKTSDKMDKTLALYNVVRKKFLQAHTQCAVFPNMRSVEIHHIAGKVGSLYLDSNNFLPVSRMGHNWIHENEAEATKLGFTISRLAINKEVI